MTLSITITELRAHDACDLDDRVSALSAHLGRTPAADEPVPLAIWTEVTPDTADLIWALRCCWDRGGRAVGVEVACRAAERAMARARDNDIPVLRASVAAARGCVAGIVTVQACRAVAAYAAAAADRAYDASDFAYTDADLAAAASVRAAYAAADSDAYAAATAATYAAASAVDTSAERAAQRADLLSLLAEVTP